MLFLFSMIISIVLGFNQNYLCPLLDKLSENKHAVLLGDFNTDLMKNDIDEHTATFLDAIFFVPHIIHSTRITPHSKTLIDNIISNTTKFFRRKIWKSDPIHFSHLAQFLIIPLDWVYT